MSVAGGKAEVPKLCLRGLPLSMRKTNLARLLARRPDGIFVAPFEQDEIGPDLFRAACRMGLEGLVSKRRDRPYQAGRSKHWVKVKNWKHPAMSRVMDSFRQSRDADPQPAIGRVQQSGSDNCLQYGQRLVP
jgi:ATP-dependent DNA ligase